jgi:NADH-quinone oxidoreductase subunit L
MALHGLQTAPFWLAMGGVALAWFFYMKRPDIPAAIQRTFKPIHTLLENKYYFDASTRSSSPAVRAARTRPVEGGDQISDRRRGGEWLGAPGGLDGADVAPLPDRHLYQYAFMMIIGVFVLLTFWFNRG